MPALNERIVAAREALGLTQAQVAERVPCGAQTISNWETARRQPRYADLARLAEVLRRPVSWFLGEDRDDASLAEAGAALERIAGELAEVRRRLETRRQPAETDLLAPLTGRLTGPRAELRREPCGWRQVAARQLDGAWLVRVETDAHHPQLLPGDVLALATADAAAPGDLALVRQPDGADALVRWQADRLELTNPNYAPLPAAGSTVVALVRWLQRDLQPGDDAAEAAAARLAWLEQAEDELARAEERIERGDGQWDELTDLADRIGTTVDALRGTYGARVAEPAARALSRAARALGELGRYPEARDLAQAAEREFAAVERLGARSREALNNLYNLSQLHLFVGDLDASEAAARTAAECDDWRVRWKALANLAEIGSNFRGDPAAAEWIEQVEALAAEHESDDATEAALARSVAAEVRGNEAFCRGDLVAARAAASDELAAAESAGLPYRLANALCNRAQYALAAGDLDAAAAALDRLAPLAGAQELGDLAAMATAHRAALQAARGDLPAARLTWRRALRRAFALGSPRARLMTELAGIAIARAEGDAAAAEDHVAEAMDCVTRMGIKPYGAVVGRAAGEER